MKNKKILSLPIALIITMYASTCIHIKQINAQTPPFPSYGACVEGHGDILTFCHQTGEVSYDKITGSCNEIYAVGGNDFPHLDRDGVPVDGHNGDVMVDEGGNCPGEEEPTPVPTSAPTPTLAPTSAPTPIPTTIPTITPAPTQIPGSKHFSLGTDIICSNVFDVVADLKDESSNPIEGTEVSFTYGSKTKSSTSNSDGRSRVSFEKAGEGNITTQANGFPDHSIKVEFPDNCKATEDIAATPDKEPTNNLETNALGITTLAYTGSVNASFANFVIFAGLVMTYVFSIILIKENKSSHEKK